MATMVDSAVSGPTSMVMAFAGIWFSACSKNTGTAMLVAKYTALQKLTSYIGGVRVCF